MNVCFRLLAGFTHSSAERQLNATKQTRSPRGQLVAQLRGRGRYHVMQS